MGTYLLTEGTVVVTKAELRETCTEIPSNATDSQLDAFIELAHMICYEDLDGGRGLLSLTRLTKIELYLASHYAAISFPVSDLERAEDVHQSAQYKVDLGFNFTKYGQQACALDSSGKLKAMTNAKVYATKVSIDWIGLNNGNPDEV
jgi:hypothetical protein